jgi:hypothetical protein
MEILHARVEEPVRFVSAKTPTTIDQQMSEEGMLGWMGPSV